MSKKIKIVGKTAERVQITGKELPRVGAAEFAAAMGAEACGVEVPGSLDPIALGADLHVNLLHAPAGPP